MPLPGTLTLELFEFLFLLLFENLRVWWIKTDMWFKKKTETSLSQPTTNILFLSQVDRENEKQACQVTESDC